MLVALAALCHLFEYNKYYLIVLKFVVYYTTTRERHLALRPGKCQLCIFEGHPVYLLQYLTIAVTSHTHVKNIQQT